jgi:TolA-binding protein
MIASDNQERRQMAVVGLLQVSDEPADLELVHGRLKDESSTVRWSAALALGQSGRVEAIPWLQEVAKSDTNDEVREAATDGVTKLQSTILWLRNMHEALKQAKESKKTVLAYFYMRGSDICGQYEDGVLADKDVVAATRPLVCVRLDVEKDADEARKLDVRGAPSILLLDGQGEEIARAQGQMEKEKLIAKLADAPPGTMTIREARRLAHSQPDNVQANWQVAQNYLDEGREELADPFLRNVINADDANAHGHTDSAIFALGFAFGKHGQYAQEVYCFQELLKRSPQYKDRDKALYCLGLGQLALGQKDKGRATLQQLMTEFPQSGTVAAAKQALDKLKDK